VPCYHGACPEIYRENAFSAAEYAQPGRLANAQELGETSMMFLVHPSLTESEIDKSCDVLDEVLTIATR
jgi:dTDP-4-amino-4,6-dideoxygalactose transaminase